MEQTADQARAVLTGYLAAVARGDRTAFRALYDATAGKLYATVLPILSDRDLARDVLQDVYVKIFERAGILMPPAPRPSPGWRRSPATVRLMRCGA